jgi:hypothetical protein
VALPSEVKTVSKDSVSVENESLLSGFVENTSSLQDENATEKAMNDKTNNKLI